MDGYDQTRYKLPSWKDATKVRDLEEIDRYNKEQRMLYAREVKLNHHVDWRGGKYNIMNIEPLPSERERLIQWMTPAQRAARKQYLQDQVLKETPKFIPELHPKNFFKRAMGLPWDVLFTALRPVLGDHGTHWSRYYVPKAAIGLMFSWLIWHNLKYKKAKWEQDQGWTFLTRRPQLYEGDEYYPLADKADDYFYNRDFKYRKAFVDNITTSFG